MKYILSHRITVYKDIEVEADSLEEALELGEGVKELLGLTDKELDDKFLDSDVQIIGVMEKL